MTATRVGMFLFGVAYWTAHRIHYDSDWARHEGYRDVLVPGPLMTAWQVDLVAAWAGSPAALVAMEDRNLAPAFPGDVLVVAGEVTAIEHGPDGTAVTCNTSVRCDDRDLVVGTYTVQLPT